MDVDGSVIIRADIDDKKAQAELNRLAKKIDGLNAKIKQAQDARMPLLEQAEQLGVQLDAAKAKLANMQAAGVGMHSAQQIADQKETVKSLQAQWNAAQSAVERYDRQIARSKSDIELAETRAGELAAQLAGGVEPSQRMGDAFKRTEKNAEALKKRVLDIARGVVQATANLNAFHRLFEKIGPAVRKLSGMIKRVFVFSVITAGLRQIRQTIGEFVQQNTALMSALNQTKGALITAFMPIYQAAVPALITLLNVITRVIAAIAQFNAMMFGTTAKQAQANAKALTAQANATEAAGGAAKDASKQLANFDEINKLTDSSGGGGAGGSAGGGASEVPTFDLEFDETPIKSWGQALSDALDGLLDRVALLPEKFKKAADRLNGFTGKVLEAFTFPGVQEKVGQLGEDLADAFNKLVTYINWNQLGAAMGAGINLALQFLSRFLYSFDWIGLGHALADSINGFIGQVDWYAAGQLLWAGFKVAIETLAGFIENVDAALLAGAASALLIGFADSIAQTAEKINWEKIGRQIISFLANIDWVGIAKSAVKAGSGIVAGLARMVTSALESVNWQGMWQKLYNGIKQIVSSVPWSNLAQTLWRAFGAAIGAAVAFIWGYIKSAWEKVVTWWRDRARGEDGQFIVSGLYDGILDALKNVGQWIQENMFLPFIKGFRNAFGIGSPSKAMKEQGGYIVSGLLTGIIDSLRGIGEWIKAYVYDPIWNAITDAFGIVGSTSSRLKEAGKAITAGIADGITSKIQQVKNAINSIIEVVERGINYLVDKINSFKVTIPPITVLGETVFAGASIGFNVPRLSIPRLAAGAVIPPNREFLAVLGDQKQGTNIEAPLDTIVAAFRQVMSEQGTGGGRQTIVLQLDRRELGRAVVDVSKLESQRVGVSLGGAY